MEIEWISNSIHDILLDVSIFYEKKQKMLRNR